MDFGDFKGTLILVTTVFSYVPLSDEHLVPDFVFMWDPLLVFPVVVLDEELLLPVMYVFPVSMEADIVDSIPVENQAETPLLVLLYGQ